MTRVAGIELMNFFKCVNKGSLCDVPGVVVIADWIKTLE